MSYDKQWVLVKNNDNKYMKPETLKKWTLCVDAGQLVISDMLDDQVCAIQLSNHGIVMWNKMTF